MCCPAIAAGRNLVVSHPVLNGARPLAASRSEAIAQARFGDNGPLLLVEGAAMQRNRSLARRLAALALILSTSGCDPVINVYGSFFPAWVVSLVAGISAAVCFRLFFAWSRLEPHLGPLMIVYPCLTMLLTCATWLVFFRG
jgi:hypothetical protein